MPPAPNNKRQRGPREVRAVNNTQGTARLKKKIRDIERLLRQEGVSATKRLENERALAASKTELTNAIQEKKVKEVAKKYHMVRFFERKKAVRRLKQANKARADATTREERDNLEDEVKRCEIDLAYNLHFPIEEKYISLYPKENADDKKSSEKREAFRKEMKDKLDQGLIYVDANHIENRKKQQQQQQQRQAPDHAQVDVNEDEDDFFGQDDE